MKNYGVFLIEPGKVEVRETAIADPGPGEVQAQCLANGICMYEVSQFSGIEPHNYPALLGHEGLGVVTKVGAGVKHIREGDYIPTNKWALYENLYSWHGKYAAPPRDIPASLAEPVSCVVTALHSYDITPGDRVLLIGAGYMGLLNVQGLSRYPLSDLIVVDVKKSNLDLARKFGATEVIQAGTPQGEERMQAIKQDQSFDLVIECAGAESTIISAGEFVRTGGRLSIFAWHHAPRALNLGLWHMRGIKVLNSAPGIGTDHNVNSFSRAIRLIERGIFDQQELVTHREDVNNVQNALEEAVSRKSDYIKGVLLFGE